MALSGISRIGGIAADVFKSPAPPFGVPEYDFLEWFTLHRPARNLIDIDLWTSNYTGGAGSNWTDRAYLVNLRTDGFEPLDRIFASGIDWRRRLAKIATDDCIKRYGRAASQYDDFGDIMDMLEDPANLRFGDHALTISLTHGLPVGDFSIQIPYAQIRQLLRANGPIAFSVLQPSG